MCTLIIGRDVLGSGTLLVGANRDEDPTRPSEPPAPLSSGSHVVGGRDVRSGGTWLAIRDGHRMIALLNRRGVASASSAALRSRGLLALDVAGAGGNPGDSFARDALAVALASIDQHAYAPFSLVCMTREGGWVLPHDGTRISKLRAIGPGWHVLTHGDLDDGAEPRTLRLKRKLEGFKPRTTGEAETRVLEMLSLHGTLGDGAPPETPEPEPADADAVDHTAVCIHTGRMVTVSTSLFRLSTAGARYIHVEGRPCTTPPRDLSTLLQPTP